MTKRYTKEKCCGMRLCKLLILWFIIGALYYVLEGLWRIPQGGYANIAMLPIGGLCGIAIGHINQSPRFYKQPIMIQSIIGTIIVLVIEFCSGCILNLWLGLGIWDYSDLKWNIMGQVCIQFSILWLLLMPFAIWVEDYLRWKLWGEGQPYTISSVYLDWITLK